METLEIKKKHVNLDNIKTLTTIANGLYSIVETNGTVHKSVRMPMIKAEAAMKILRDREPEQDSQTPAKLGTELPNQKISATPKRKRVNLEELDPEKIVNSLEGHDFLAVQHLYKNQNYVCYWEDIKKTASRVAMGYDFTMPEDLNNYDLHFRAANIGIDSNPDGYIQFEGMVLMHTTRAMAEAIRQSNINKQSNVGKTGIENAQISAQF